MQLPLTKNSFLRPGTLLVALAISTALAPPTAQGQSRRAKASASSPNAKIQALEARRRKAIATFNNAADVVNRRAVFQVLGKIERGNTARLLVYGRSYGQNRAAASALGENNDDNFLIIHNADPQRIMHGRYQGYCIALSQTEFTPVPASYYTAVATLDKYREIIRSLESEIKFQKAVRLAMINSIKKPGRERVYRARLAIANQEVAIMQSRFDAALAASSPNNRGAVLLQNSAQAVERYNKWGARGIALRPFLERALEDLAYAAAWQVERGNWNGASSTVEKMIGLEVYDNDPKIQDDTGTIRTVLLMQATGEWPTLTAQLVLRRPGPELDAVSVLAKTWLEKLPAYIQGSASREEKVSIVELSQLLGSSVFAPKRERYETILSAINQVIAKYGRDALTLTSEYEYAWSRL